MRIASWSNETVVSEEGHLLATFHGKDAERRAREFVERETKPSEPANKYRTPWRVKHIPTGRSAPTWEIYNCDGSIVWTTVMPGRAERIVHSMNFLEVAEKVDLKQIVCKLRREGYESTAAKLNELVAALEAQCPTK